ncbi:hypothetical protein DFA_06482 [Cavenderia fasciculata]|uniref:Blue (type 1) copper domain-containing protein n=1 Tax=Cavenderia fasciculata TaxID=261658 RepID=F4PJ46_CACFS|nr:uncharacterized protein DFA_06482 [Cavenderia fasciculata]EGG24332.1 hypothetical protein DFA_06482 [Cavenderia fasciculata]|eukprot:XP_004362183.1 hypothetical protein DFA_06482 [Cavenderia fasciculata]
MLAFKNRIELKEEEEKLCLLSFSKNQKMLKNIRIFILSIIVLLSLKLNGYGDYSYGGAVMASKLIRMTEWNFINGQQPTLNIDQDDIVIWFTTDNLNHTVTHDAPVYAREFDSEDLNSDPLYQKPDNFTHHFNTNGTYRYYCKHYPSQMFGMIYVSYRELGVPDPNLHANETEAPSNQSSDGGVGGANTSDHSSSSSTISISIALSLFFLIISTIS